MRQNRTEAVVGKAEVKLVVAETPEDRYLSGALWTEKGWYWWLSVDTAVGTISGQVKGPHATEQQARDAGYAAVDAGVARRDSEARAA